MAEGYGEQIARVEDLKKQAEGKTVLLTPLQGITESARKGEQSLKSLSPKLKSDEAKKYLAASVPKVNNYLKGIADKGFSVIQTRKDQIIEQADVAPINQLRASLLSSLDEQKAELDNIDRLEQQDAALKALEQKEKEIDGDKDLKLEEKIKAYGELHQSVTEIHGKLFRNLLTAEGTRLLQSLDQNIKKMQVRVGYKVTDLNIALKCREKYAQYVKVDDKGNITYSDSLLAMKKDNPAEYRRIMNEILKGVTGVQDKEGADFMKIESELAALRSKVDAYKKAVEEFEKNPTPETRHQLKESRPQLPYPGFPGSKERAELKVPGGEFLNDVYSTIDRVSVPYKKMQEDMASLDKRVEKKEEEQNKEMVKQLIDALDKNWNETVKPKQTEYGTFKTTSLPDYLFILSLDEKLVTPDMKAKRESYKGTYDKVSEELLRCMLAVENMVSPFMSKNLDAASRGKIMAKYKEAEKNVNEIESDRIRIQSTTTLKTITQPGATNLLSYVIWKPQGPDGKNYDINEEMLSSIPVAQRDLIRSQIRLAIANNREAVQAQTEKANQEILTPDPKLAIAKLREQYGEKAKTYFDALQLFDSGDLNAAAKGLRDFIVYYDTLSPADKLTLAPLLGEAREKIKLVAIRQVAILESLEADIRAVYSPLQAAVRQGRDNAFTAEQRNQISTEEMAVMSALGVLKKRVQEGQATDITELLDSIRQKLAKGANRYGLIEKLNTMFQAQNDLHSSDPAKKAAAIAELQKFADKATNMDTRLYDIGKKYLNMILEQDKKDAEQEANAKGYTREEISQQIISSPQAMASIKALAKQYYDQFLKDNPGAKDKISIEQAEQFVLRRKTDEFYQETLQRYMSQSPKWKDNTSVKMYNKWFPADRASFWEVWNYSLEEQHAFADECAKLTFESILTLPVGMGAGAVGKMVTRMALRGMLKMAGERAGLEAGLLMMERGGLMALRAGSAEMQMLSPALRVAVMNNSTRAALGAMGTAAWGSGVIAEGATMRALGDASSFLSSGQIPLYLQAESTENHMDFSHALTESMVKVMLFRFMGSAGQGLFGAGMRAGGASAITANLGMETFSGAGGAAIELAFMSPEERVKNGMNPSFWVKSILQNAIVSAGTHLAHGTSIGKGAKAREGAPEEPGSSSGKAGEPVSVHADTVLDQHGPTVLEGSGVRTTRAETSAHPESNASVEPTPPVNPFLRSAIVGDLQGRGVNVPENIYSAKLVVNKESGSPEVIINDGTSIPVSDLHNLPEALYRRVNDIIAGNKGAEKITTGEILLDRQKVDTLLSNREGIENLESILKNPQSRIEGTLDRNVLIQEIAQAKKRIEIVETKNEMARLRKGQKPEEMAHNFDLVIEKMLRNEAIDSQNPYGKILSRFRERNPEQFEMLSHSNVEHLVSSNCLDAIIAGDYVDLSVEPGKTQRVFEGSRIGKGGGGEMFNVALTSPDGNAFTVGAMKKPFNTASGRAMFAFEKAAAIEISSWQNENIIKPMVVGENFIIYETSPRCMSYSEALTTLGPAEVMRLYGEALNGFKYAEQRTGFIITDPKPDNILIMEVTVGGQKKYVAKLIDNSLVAPDKIVEFKYPHTGWYAPTSTDINKSQYLLRLQGKSQPEINAWMGRAYSNHCRGRIMEDLILGVYEKVPGLTASDREAIVKYYDELGRLEKIESDTGVRPEHFPRFPHTSNTTLNRAGRFIDTSRNLVVAGNPAAIDGLITTVDGLHTALGGATLSPPPSPGAARGSAVGAGYLGRRTDRTQQ